ncbi:penicillin-binding protein 2 [Oleiphilus sp. HI0125]|uniref:peptidoglycan D,D-transpeptidase FtsI family protein n=2 Tax=Oleiphilus sp. HI0125 TaxID=1822266 RepID=UPI000A647281|nr:penicillin-binding protein 2 [Oleiphilus sp. HI0125]
MSDKPLTNTHIVMWRYYALLAILCLVVLTLMGRAVHLHIFEQSFLSHQGDVRSIRLERLDAHRGTISDRYGEPLAISAAVETIYANPTQVKLGDEEYAQLAAALGVNKRWLKRRLESNRDKQFVYLKRKAAPHEAQQALQLGFSGIYSRREYKRFYPAGEVASHIVGFSNIDEKGQEGIELAYDEWLTGREGKRRVLKNRAGQVIKDLGVVELAQSGNDISLSIDMRLQYLAYRELKAAVDIHRARAGSVVVLDIETGEVLAMVNQPSYNPNNRSNLNVSHLRNRAITDLFEPGSTMKLVTLASALESEKYALNNSVETSPGFLRLGGRSIRDHRDYGRLSLLEVIAKSSNVGTSKLALDLGPEALWDSFYALGLGQGTGIGFPGESIGQLPNPFNMQPVELAAMSYGYGLSTTALQLAQAYMVLGNGGLKPSLSLIKKESKESVERVLPESVSNELLKAMRATVEKGGTGTRAQVPLYSVGGKTGTVHTVGRDGYNAEEYKALFAGVAPINDPKIATVVVIDAPAGAEYYGGEVAAPIFSRVVDGAMRILSVEPDKFSQLMHVNKVESSLAGGRG